MKGLPHLFLASTLVLSCGHERNLKSPEVEPRPEAHLPASHFKNPFPASRGPEQHDIDTKYIYTAASGGSVIVENSYPRGGQVYTGTKGERYTQAVFFTRITNNTIDSLKLAIAFPERAYRLPSSPNRIFKLLVPADTMLAEKEVLKNYGLDLEKYLEGHLYTRDNFKRTIPPNTHSAFYVVTLFNRGVEGPLRTGLMLEKNSISYRVNEKVIDCGKMNGKNLELLR